MAGKLPAGKKSRSKGQRGEREARRWLKEQFGLDYEINRGIHYCHGQDGVDLLPLDGRMPPIQVKNRDGDDPLAILTRPPARDDGIVWLMKIPRRGWLLCGFDVELITGYDTTWERRADGLQLAFCSFRAP